MLASTSSPANPVGGKTVKATLTVRFGYTQKTQGPSSADGHARNRSPTQHEKNITVTHHYAHLAAERIIRLLISVGYGEPVPYGLAGYILALEGIPGSNTKDVDRRPGN